MAELCLSKEIQLSTDGRYSILRVRGDDLASLNRNMFSRYPDREWGTFFRFGWRRTSWGVHLTFVDGMWPGPGDMGRQTGLAEFRDLYSSRAFRTASNSGGLGIGVAHSHPSGSSTRPSPLDADMDLYYAREFSSFTNGVPYCSMIFQQSDERGYTISGRVYDRGDWLPVNDVIVVGATLRRIRSELVNQSANVLDTTMAYGESTNARLQGLLGQASGERLNSSVVGVVGCSGTGSPAIELLARAGIGGLVLVDPDKLSPSNLERVHGSRQAHLESEQRPLKVDVMREMVGEINPNTKITALAGNVLHDNVLDELLRCDLLLGCMDSYHGRAALSEIAHHYLLPSIDVGVSMSGADGTVTSQLADYAFYSPDLPCAYCRGRIDSRGIAFELMPETERALRKTAADEAAARGIDPDQYWGYSERQIHTVGYLTTLAGALSVGYAIGWLTGSSSAPFQDFQIDPSKPRFGCVQGSIESNPDCSCHHHIGWADAARSHRNVVLPSHWPKRAMLRYRT